MSCEDPAAPIPGLVTLDAYREYGFGLKNPCIHLKRPRTPESFWAQLEAAEAKVVAEWEHHFGPVPTQSSDEEF